MIISVLWAIFFLLLGTSVALMAVYAFMRGKFPEITINMRNSYKDETCKPVSLGAGATYAPMAADVIKTPPIIKETPFDKKDEEVMSDPLEDMLGNVHELFTGSDRIDGKGQQPAK